MHRVTRRYTLIHNLNYWAAFPIDQDGYLSPTFQVTKPLTHLPGDKSPWKPQTGNMKAKYKKHFVITRTCCSEVRPDWTSIGTQPWPTTTSGSTSTTSTGASHFFIAISLSKNSGQSGSCMTENRIHLSCTVLPKSQDIRCIQTA